MDIIFSDKNICLYGCRDDGKAIKKYHARDILYPEYPT
jgi:hypothetical protein